MSGINREKVGEITQGKKRGKALVNELSKELNSQEAPKYAKRKKHK